MHIYPPPNGCVVMSSIQCWSKRCSRCPSSEEEEDDEADKKRSKAAKARASKARARTKASGGDDDDEAVEANDKDHWGFDTKEVLAVGPDKYCVPRYHPHCRPSFLKLKQPSR